MSPWYTNIGPLPCIIKVSLVLCFPLLFLYSLSFPKLRFSLQRWEGKEYLETGCVLSPYPYSPPSFQQSSRAQLSYICGMSNSLWVPSKKWVRTVLQFNSFLDIWVAGRRERLENIQWILVLWSFIGTERSRLSHGIKIPQSNTTSRGLGPPFFLTNQSYKSGTGGTLQPQSSSFVT